MSVLVNILLVLAFAGAVAASVHFWRVHLETARRDEMQALAARRGWALTVTGERLGRAGTLRLVPRGGLPWVAESRPELGRPGGPVTEYEAEAPRWADGTLILLPAALAEPPEGDVPDPFRRERVLREILGEDLARTALMLAPVPAPAGLVAYSDANPSLRVDLSDLGRALRDWTPVSSGPRGRPALVLSPEGLRLRLQRPIKRPDQMERFLDLALELSRLIGP